MLLTYKYKLKGKRIGRILRKYAESCNQVWNYCNEQQKKNEKSYKNGLRIKWLTHFDLHPLTKGTSTELGVHAQTIQEICKQYVKNRDKAKRSLRFRKSQGSKRSLGWIPFSQQSRQVTGNSVTYLGNTFRFFGAKRRLLPEKVKGGCFVENARGQWFVCLLVEAEYKETGTGKVGIDLGLKDLAVLSTGEKIENPRTYRLWEQKLGIVQRAHNKNRVKAIHAKITNIRKDFLHKASAKIAKENRLIVVGNVSSSKLAKTKMAKSVLDAGWYTFKEMLDYKARRHQATYLEVDEKFTTQNCSHCLKISSGSPKGRGDLGIRSWVCSECGTCHDRDTNAAKNILQIGLSAQPPAEESCLNLVSTISNQLFPI